MSAAVQASEKKVVWSDAEKAYLDPFKDEFKGGNGEYRKNLLQERVLPNFLALYHPNSIDAARDALKRKVKVWFSNNCRRPKKRSAFPLLPNASFKKVFAHMKRKEIEDVARKLTNIPPGNPQYLGFLAQAQSIVMKGLSEADKSKIKAEQVEWDLKGWAADAKPKEADKRAHTLTKEMDELRYNRMGMRCITFGWWKNTTGQVAIELFDNNGTLGGHAVDGIRKEFDDEVNVFSTAIWQYALKVAQQEPKGAAGEIPTLAQAIPPIKTAPVLGVSSAGFPLLPHATPGETLGHKKDLLRAFINVSYVLACGRPKAAAPYKLISASNEEWADSQYWPPGLIMSDPSRMNEHEITIAIDFWRNRGKECPNDTFKFKQVEVVKGGELTVAPYCTMSAGAPSPLNGMEDPPQELPAVEIPAEISKAPADTHNTREDTPDIAKANVKCFSENQEAFHLPAKSGPPVPSDDRPPQQPPQLPGVTCNIQVKVGANEHSPIASAEVSQTGPFPQQVAAFPQEPIRHTDPDGYVFEDMDVMARQMQSIDGTTACSVGWIPHPHHPNVAIPLHGPGSDFPVFPPPALPSASDVPMQPTMEQLLGVFNQMAAILKQDSSNYHVNPLLLTKPATTVVPQLTAVANMFNAHVMSPPIPPPTWMIQHPHFRPEIEPDPYVTVPNILRSQHPSICETTAPLNVTPSLAGGSKGTSALVAAPVDPAAAALIPSPIIYSAAESQTIRQSKPRPVPRKRTKPPQTVEEIEEEMVAGVKRSRPAEQQAQESNKRPKKNQKPVELLAKTLEGQSSSLNAEVVNPPDAAEESKPKARRGERPKKPVSRKEYDKGAIGPIRRNK